MKLKIVSILLSGYCIFFAGCVGKMETSTAKLPTGPLYTKHNLWSENWKLRCINYKTGKIVIPAGTAVKDVQKDHVEEDSILFTTVENGKTYRISMNRRWHDYKYLDHCKNEIFSTADYSQLIEGFTEAEVEAIREGKVITGMSKKAVLVSQGHPPEHRTPSTSDNTWLYWRNKFVKDAVCFENDRVVDCKK